MLKIIFIFLCYTLIPGATAYLANSEFLFNLLIEANILSDQFNIPVAQEVCLIINVAFTILIIGPKIIIEERKLKSSKRETEDLYNMVKTIFGSTFESIVKKKPINFDMRIFVPMKTPSYFLSRFSKKAKIYFEIKNIAPFAKSDATAHLRFRVTPNPQGLVGDCYTQKEIIFDNNLQQTNSSSWNLEQAQIARTSSLLWSLCIPIIDQSSNVIAVIALDSTDTALDIAACRAELASFLMTYATLLHDSAPSLFKGRFAIK